MCTQRSETLTSMVKSERKKNPVENMNVERKKHTQMVEENGRITKKRRNKKRTRFRVNTHMLQSKD